MDRSTQNPAQGQGPHLAPSALLTAAKLVATVSTVTLLVAVEAGWDTCICGYAAELCGATYFLRTLGSWGTKP